MATEPVRKGRRLNRGTVLRTERLTPHMIRVVLGGEDLAGFGAGAFTDHYVKLLFPQPGVEYPEPFDMERVRAEMPRDLDIEGRELYWLPSGGILDSE